MNHIPKYSSDDYTSANYLSGRPGCVTFHAVILVFGSVVFFGLLCSMPPGVPNAGLLTFIVVVFAPLSVITAFGLWRMKEWARKLLIATYIIGFGLNFLSLCAGTLSIRSLASTVVGLICVYWYTTNAHLFE